MSSLSTRYFQKKLKGRIFIEVTFMQTPVAAHITILYQMFTSYYTETMINRVGGKQK